MRTIGLTILLCLTLSLAACGSDSGDDTNNAGNGNATTVEAVCNKIFECFDSNWGWDTQDSCEAQFMDTCKDTDGYMKCAAVCVAGACAGFESCEPDCWTKNCD